MWKIPLITVAILLVPGCFCKGRFLEKTYDPKQATIIYNNGTQVKSVHKQAKEFCAPGTYQVVREGLTQGGQQLVLVGRAAVGRQKNYWYIQVVCQPESMEASHVH